MKKTNIVSTAVLTAALFTGSTALAETWVIDQGHSHVGFSVAHLVVTKTKGQFNEFSGELSLDPKDVTKSRVDVTIKTDSIDTNDEKRDEHLRNPDFLDTKKFPTMTFKSTKVKKTGKGKLLVTGDLTLHGVTKPVTLTVEGPSKSVTDPWGNVKRAVSATGKLSRKDFGLTWNKALETGGMVVGDEITLIIEAELNQKK